MLHASETRRATSEVVRSFMRVVPSPRCTKASRNPVQPCTSNNSSGRSIFGSIFSTRFRSHVRDFGSPSGPSLDTFSFARPPGGTSMVTFVSCPAVPSRSAICFHAASSAITSAARCSSTGISRLRSARTSLPHGLPLRTVQQPGARVGPAVRGRGEHVPALKRAVQLLQHAHHVCVPVHGPRRQLGVGIHRLAPRGRHQLVIDLARQQRLVLHPPPRQSGQPLHPGQHPLPAGRRVQGLRLAQQRQEWPHRVVPGGQRRPHRDGRRVLVLRHQRNHQHGRTHHRGPGRDLLHRPPQCRRIQIRAVCLDQLQLLEQHLRRPRQGPRRLLQLRQRREPLLVRCPLRRADQPRRHQHREQVQGLIDRFGLKVAHHRGEHRRALGLCGPLQARSLGPQP